MRSVALLLVLWPCVAFAGPYEDCILANMRGVQAQAAAFAIARACKETTTPQRCRESNLRPTMRPTWGNERFNAATGKKEWVPLDYVSDAQFNDDQQQCIRNCASASWTARTFGECRTG